VPTGTACVGFGRHPSTAPTRTDVPENSKSLSAVGLWQLAVLSSESTRLKVSDYVTVIVRCLVYRCSSVPKFARISPGFRHQ
jgi:hypothetical protein